MTVRADTRPTERECQTTIIDAARHLGYLVHHARPARSARGWSTPIEGDPGFPDLVIAGHNHLFIVELKRRPRQPTSEQYRWLGELRSAVFDDHNAVATVLYVPEEMDEFIDGLQEAAGR